MDNQMRVGRCGLVAGIGLSVLSLALGGIVSVRASAEAPDSAAAAPSAGCGAISCTVYVPNVFNTFPPPAHLEVTQGVQQPDNSIHLIEDRPTWVRYTLTSTVAHANVSAFLHGTRNGATLPGSPLAARNNPRTLKSTADRGVLNDTFNFQLPSTWLTGTISLHASAGNGSTFNVTSGAKTYPFVSADSLAVAVVPIAYTCAGGGTVTPAGPYDYLLDYTFQTYPVPYTTLSTRASLAYTGPCTSGLPNPTFTDWSNILNAVTARWSQDGRPDTYYYGLIKVHCAASCIAGIGWIGYLKAAAGFEGFGASHAGASETHAHEVGHNHSRQHAPCGVTPADSNYPYATARIGDSAHPNYGFNIDTQAVYAYSTRYDVMSYCDPTWISDYTYEALRQWNLTDSALPAVAFVGERAWMVSGAIDPASGQVTLRPAFALDAPARIPEPGDYAIEMLDVTGAVLALYPFSPGRAHADQRTAIPFAESPEYAGFHLTLPYVEGTASIQVRHGDDIAGVLQAGPRTPTLAAGAGALDASGQSLRIGWAAADADRDRLTYLVRASTDDGATWQMIGLHLMDASIDLRAADFGGRSVLVEVLASDGLHTRSIRLGPFEMPRLTRND